ncbi:MAG TPA: EamA family transporter [Bryobacteraceae bacterium]|nr:EamA family transporter [Bryobacteraceae bacterium]
MHRHPHFSAYLALAAVCFFWGTTYLAIRMSLESFPPLLLVSLRFIISGSLMLAVIALRGEKLPRGRHLGAACLSGVLVLGIGNGCLVMAEVWVPSGVACLIITISPFWMVGVEALLPGGESLHLPSILGMLVGLAGAALLFAPDLHTHTFNAGLLNGFLVLQVGMAGWAFGSIYQRRRVSGVHPIVTGAVQQLAAGLSFLPLALVFHEHPVEWSLRGAAAVMYLVTFGSIVGYSAYIFALDRLPVAVVSIYPYVNSVVAVTLGWLFYREPFGPREAAAMAVIFTGVALVKRYSRPVAARLAVAAGRRD